MEYDGNSCRTTKMKFPSARESGREKRQRGGEILTLNGREISSNERDKGRRKKRVKRERERE